MPESIQRLKEPEAQKKILEAYKKYVESGGSQFIHLEYIQSIVDAQKKPFVLVIPGTNRKGKLKGIPHKIKFQPRTKIEDHGILQ